MSEVVREPGQSEATFAAVVIMINRGLPGLVLSVSLAILFHHQISHDSHTVGGVEARVNALDTSRWRTHGHEHHQQRHQR
jgi:hypothetical protein